MRKQKNRAKYSFTCAAPEELTRYNEDYNKAIRDACFQKEEFQPHVSCFHNKQTGEPCKYLKVKRYG